MVSLVSSQLEARKRPRSSEGPCNAGHGFGSLPFLFFANPTISQGRVHPSANRWHTRFRSEGPGPATKRMSRTTRHYPVVNGNKKVCWPNWNRTTASSNLSSLPWPPLFLWWKPGRWVSELDNSDRAGYVVPSRLRRLYDAFLTHIQLISSLLFLLIFFIYSFPSTFSFFLFLFSRAHISSCISPFGSSLLSSLSNMIFGNVTT